MYRALQPVIKWSGSKRSVAPLLAALFPEAKRYFEPFVGGGAMLPFRKSAVAFASDAIAELIALWIEIRDRPQQVAHGYQERWSRRQRDGYKVYYTVRDRFNQTRDVNDFLFLSRTCVNGLIRFNLHGDFNNSLHHTRPGIAPERLACIIKDWSRAIQRMSFDVSDYKAVLRRVRKDDFVFLDPPYESTRGRYQAGGFSADEFYSELERLNNVGAKWMLTYDGEAGGRRYSVNLPSSLFTVKLGVSTGQSPFTRLMNTTLDKVTESVYLNYEPPRKIVGGDIQEINHPVQLAVSFDMNDGLSGVDDELNAQY